MLLLSPHIIIKRNKTGSFRVYGFTWYAHAHAARARTQRRARSRGLTKSWIEASATSLHKLKRHAERTPMR